MKRSHRWTALLLAGLLVFGLAACNNTTDPTKPSLPEVETAAPTEEPTIPIPEYDFAPTTTGIFIRRDKTIQSAEVTSFDTKKYKESELRAQVETWIAEYNKALGRDAVSMDTLIVADNRATLILNYDSPNAFLDFQGADFGVTEITVGTALEAATKMSLKNLKNPAGGNVNAMDALVDDEVTVLRISGKINVTTQGDIQFLSNTLTLSGTNSVRVNSDAPVFIIFR